MPAAYFQPRFHESTYDMAPCGMVLEKIEGLAITSRGEVIIVNNKDGVDASYGETQLLRLGAALPLAGGWERGCPVRQCPLKQLHHIS